MMLVFAPGVDSELIECIDQGASTKHESRLAVFDLTNSFKEPFTLNLVPHWEKGLKNRFLVIDEIAYIGECAQVEKPRTSATSTLSPTTLVTTPRSTEVVPEPIEERTQPPLIITATRKTIWPQPRLISLPTVHVVKPSTKDPYPKKKTYPTRPPFRWVTPTRFTTEEPVHENYCDSLNCNFDENACSYLNHGLTKKPWTLRNRASTNGQFVSTILDPGDIAILESPKMNATRSLNVLLFQYFRPSQMTTIRLCLGLHSLVLCRIQEYHFIRGSRYTNPYRTVAAFTHCPAILRSVTTKNAYRWNTVH
ncbi:unnamed protein product, partial [Cylicostephanus goldi]